jgi:hypothetical protein
VAKAQLTVLHLDVNSTTPLDATTTRFHPALALLLLRDLSSVMFCMVEPVSTTAQWLEPLLSLMMTKATFFITGNNNGKGEIDNAALPWAATVKRAYNEGHQIASHTWTHPHLSNLTSTQRKQNMYSNEMALRNILGFFPTYMRPPYSDCTAESGCQKDMADLGYHVTYFDVDTGKVCWILH